MSFRERAAERAERSAFGQGVGAGSSSSLGRISYRSPGRDAAASPGRALSPRRSVRESLVSPGRRGGAASPGRRASGRLFGSSPGRSEGGLGAGRAQGLGAGRARSDRLSPGRSSSPGRFTGDLSASPARSFGSPGRFSGASRLGSSGRFGGAALPARDAVDVDGWGAEAVSQWLGRVGLGEYAEAFAAARIDGPSLLDLAEMSDQALAEQLGMSDEFHRRKMRRELSKLGGEASIAGSDRNTGIRPGSAGRRGSSSNAAGEPQGSKAARAAKRELLRVDGEWEMHFQVLLREKDGVEAKLRDAEVKIATLEEENASLRNASQAGNVLAATQGESYRSVAEGKVQLEATNARLQEDIRRHEEDRREDKMKIAAFNEEKQQRQAEARQLQEQLRELQQENKELAQSLTDHDMNQALGKPERPASSLCRLCKIDRDHVCLAAVEKRSETIAEEKLLLEKKLESKDEERVGLEREMAGAKAQLRTQQVEHEAVVVRPPPSASSCRSVCLMLTLRLQRHTVEHAG